MKKKVQQLIRFFIICVFILGAMTGPGASLSHAFLYEVEVLDTSAIGKLKDEELADRYIDASIEIEASGAFHEASGFNPKEYRSFKRILRFRVDLMREILRRELELPKIKP